MDLQAIRYAAMVSAMSFSKAVEVFARYLERNGRIEDAASTILQFLNWDVANEETFGQDVGIVLVSAEFSKEITTSVLWLNERDLDIRPSSLRTQRSLTPIFSAASRWVIFLSLALFNHSSLSRSCWLIAIRSILQPRGCQ